MWSLSFTQFALIFVFFVLTSVCAILVKDGRSDLIWIVFGLGICALVSWAWYSNGLQFIIDFIINKTLFIWLATYLAIGILYSACEFFIITRKIAKDLEKYWKVFLTSNINVCIYDDDGKIDNKGQERLRRMTMAELLKHPQLGIDNHPIGFKINEELKHFIACFSSSYSDMIRIKRTSKISVGGKLIETYIEKSAFSKSIINWIFLWPVYMFSNILFEILSYPISVIGNLFISIFNKIVDRLFCDVFTLKS